jgi:hypothetical protein
MNAISKISITVFSIATLTACSNKNEANESNFLTSLQQHYQNSNLCFEEKTPMRILDLNKTPAFQREFLNQLSQDPTSNFGRLIGLEKAGLIVRPNNGGNFYELSDLGKKYATKSLIHRPFQEEKTALKFCWGKIYPSEITNFDMPNPNSSYQKTTVKYKYKVTNLADWAKNNDIQKSYPQVSSVLEMQNKKEIQQALKLTNLGWEVIE